MTTMNPVVHFQMPYDDRERMARFYEASFGWQTQMLGEDMGNYVLATTTETDEKGPKTPGRINGGFFQKCDSQANHPPSVVIAVEEIHAAMARVKRAGGTVLGEPMGDPQCRPVRRLPRHRGQRGRHAAADPAQLARAGGRVRPADGRTAARADQHRQGGVKRS